jgi:hypothetical protein
MCTRPCAHTTGSGRAQPPSGMGAPCGRRQLTVLSAPRDWRRLTVLDARHHSPSRRAPPSEESRAAEEGRAVGGGRPSVPPARQRRRAAQVERDPQDALRWPTWPTAIALPGSSPAAVSRSESETASAAGRIGGVAPATPGAGQRATRDQRARRRRRAVCRGRDGRWGRVARRWLGRTLRRRTSEDRESSTRCRQSLEEAQAAMLSSGSLHFGSPRVQPGFPIRPSARSSEVSPFLPASAVVRLPHT